MKKNKLLAVLLALAMTLSLLPTAALAAEGEGVDCSAGCSDAENHVAAIGTTHYTSLQDAVDNVSNDQTIMLLQDVSNAQITVAGKGTIDHPVVLDLNGKTITGAEKKDALSVKSSAVLTVTDNSTNKNGKIIANGGNAIYVSYATANLNAGQYTAKGDCTIYDSNSTLNISGGTFTQHDANYLIYLYDTKATANISGGTFIQNGAKSLIYISSGTNAQATISGGTFTNKGNQMMLDRRYGQYNITGGTFNGGRADILADSIYYTVSGGQFSAPIPVDTVAVAGKTSASAAVEGYYGLVDLEDGAAPVTLTYKDGSAVDQTSYYASPYQALSAASDKTGAVVTVIKNVETSRSLAPYGKAKLVVSQGTQLSCSSITVSAGAFSGVSVENNGTIVTTGMISGSMGSCKLVNNGIITCGGSFIADTAGWENNGTIEAAGNITLKSFTNGSDGTIVGASGKTMTVKDCGITMKSNSYPKGTYNWDATAGWVPSGIITVMKGNNALAGYDSLSEAYDYAKENSADTLKLQGDIIQSGVLVVPAGKSITLDLNGHTISRGGQLSSKGIIDVSGTLTVKDSTAATVPVVNADGSVTYDSGAIRSTYSSDVIYVHNGGTFTLESGTIVGCEDYAAVKIANMNMADDRTAADVGASNAVVNINGGLVRSENGYGVAMFGTGTTNNPQATDPVLNVSGGVIISSNTTAIIGQGTYYNTKINISGGKIISPNAVAIYHPQYGAMTVTGGEITGASGIEMRAGTLSVSSDAKIAGTATTFEKQENGSGNTVLGAGIAVSQHTTNLPLSVTISETNDKTPTITGIYALYEEDLQNETGTDKIALNISGGNFVGTGSTAIFSENVAKFITGGTYSDFSCLDYLGDSANVTVKLTDNVTLASTLELAMPGKAVVLDLNTHSLNGRVNLKGGTLTLRNGKVIGAQPLNVYGSSDANAKDYSVLNVESTVTVNNENDDKNSVVIFPNNGTVGYGAVANVAGKINGTVFVSGNLGNSESYNDAMRDSNRVNIKSTATVISAADQAIAMNGAAVVTIENGATVTGREAVGIKRGALNVTGGKLTATGIKIDPVVANNNGTEASGAALSITNTYNKYGKINVNISGGTITSKNNDAIYKGVTTDGGASFTTEPTISITGGTFSSNPSAYVASGYAVRGSGPYTVYLPSSTPSTPTPPSQPTTSTETKPDGSTTTTETKPDGTVTESNTSKPTTDASGNTSQTTTETTTGKDGVTESKTETVTKPDGSASSTTESTTTKPDGTKTESTTETTVNKDGSTASTTTATTTNKDGTVTESKTEATTSTVTNKDGSTTETKQETTTTSTGSKTESTTVTTVNKDGSTTATTTATTTDKAGTVTESKTESTTSKNGTTTEVTVTTETKANGTVIESKTATTTQTNGSSSSTTTATTTKADGTTTTSKTTATTSLSTNKTTGTVTETKKETTTTSDGVKSEGTTVTQIQKDGTVTSTETVKASDSTGTTATKTTTLDAKGEVTTTAEVSVSSKAVTEAAKTGVAVTIPVEVTATKSASTAPTVSVSVPKTAESVKVELPVQNVTPGTVAVIVNADGTEKIVSTSMVTENGVALKLDGSATVKLVDNAKSFTDVPETNVFYNEISSLSARNIMIGVSNEKFDLHNSVTLNQVANVAGRITGEVDVNDFNAGVVWGNENGLKTGSTAATRGEVLKALYVAAGSPAVEDTSILSRFKDASSIPADLAAIAAWAAQNGILKGNMDGTAALSANVTRGQACALAGRTMGTLA